MSSNDRSEARSVILRLRRYRDRIGEIATAATHNPPDGSVAANVIRRKLKALKSDLDNDAHECAIGRNRAVQTECENRFLWPALREAAGAISDPQGLPAAHARSSSELQAAELPIRHYLDALEQLYPTL